jgi:hypothetical protein
MIDMNNAAREVLRFSAVEWLHCLAIKRPKENSVKIKFCRYVPAFEGAARFAIKTGAQVIFGWR